MYLTWRVWPGTRLGAAVGLFNSVVNFVLLFAVNRVARGISEISLW